MTAIAPQSAGDALHAVTLTESAFTTLHDLIPQMDDDQLIATYQRADELGKRAWLVQAHCLWEARQRKQGHNDDALSSLARRFGMTKEWAGKLCGAWEAVPEQIRIRSDVDLPLAKSFYVVAGETDTPQEWSAWAEDRKAENPGYSVRDLRADIDQDQNLFEEPRSVMDIPPLANHQLINQSTNDRWFTPRAFLDAAHELMGGVDLDPASEEYANRVVRAARFYTETDNGLQQPWEGRVWLNPPYGIGDGESNQARWSRRLIAAYHGGSVTEALLLVNAVTGNNWFAPLKHFPICFPDSRIRFYNEETEASQPTHSNAIVYLGPQVARFAVIYGRFGPVMATREVWEGA